MTLDFEANAAPEDLWREDSARDLHPSLYLGTSTWTFPEWKGLVYRHKYSSERDFKQRSLEEYASVPWFRTVCIDSFFYSPPKAETLLRYSEQVPSDFIWMSKVWERLTIVTYPKHARYGVHAGKTNPDFLNSDLMSERVLSAYSDEAVRQHTGPLVLQFAPFARTQLDYDEFVDRLGEFLAKLPKEFEFAVEVRNKEILTDRYFKMLNEVGATHCFNTWGSMASMRDQMQLAARAGGLTASYFAARLLTPPGISYEQAGKLLEPYTHIKRPSVAMRSDVVRLARRALALGKRAFITSNNKAEGNAALTMVTLAKLIVESTFE